MIPEGARKPGHPQPFPRSIHRQIDTGSVVYRAPSQADERLADFDGRYLVLTTTDRHSNVPPDGFDQSAVSTIRDIAGTTPDHSVEGQVRLIWTEA